jgi:hypothetical protein
VYSVRKELFDRVLGSGRIKIRFEANAGNIIGRREGFRVDEDDWVLKPRLELSCIKGPKTRLAISKDPPSVESIARSDLTISIYK